MEGFGRISGLHFLVSGQSIWFKNATVDFEEQLF
jgi:hypothetical protein